MQQVTLVPARPSDADRIRELAVLIWNQHYPEIISQDQIDYMLEKMYSEASLKEQMVKDHHHFFFIQAEKPVGFLSVASHENKVCHINKIYIDQRVAAKGLGTESLKLLIAKFPAKKYTLTVNRQNYKSINFYFKNGFVIDRVADFDIGNGYVMNDFVMVREES